MCLCVSNYEQLYNAVINECVYREKLVGAPHYYTSIDGCCHVLYIIIQ